MQGKRGIYNFILCGKPKTYKNTVVSTICNVRQTTSTLLYNRGSKTYAVLKTLFLRDENEYIHFYIVHRTIDILSNKPCVFYTDSLHNPVYGGQIFLFKVGLS